ncbi:MAG: hypothetical protein V4692_06790 [Bdellovibrionota bacterium]
MKKLVLLALVAIIAGCVGVSKDQKPSGGLSDLAESGIVLGEMIPEENGLGMGIGISLRDMKSGKDFEIFGAKKFFMKLPPGEYQLHSIGTRNRPLMPFNDANAIKFTIEPKQIRYIGSFLRGLRTNKEQIDAFGKAGRALAVHHYIGYTVGFMGIGSTVKKYDGDDWMIFAVDNFDEVHRDFLVEYPEFKYVSIARPTKKLTPKK